MIVKGLNSLFTDEKLIWTLASEAFCIVVYYDDELANIFSNLGSKLKNISQDFPRMYSCKHCYFTAQEVKALFKGVDEANKTLDAYTTVNKKIHN